MNAIAYIFIGLICLSPVLSPDRQFVGSTPCFNDLKDQLNVSASEGCEFIKWKLTMGATGTWSAEVNYGISQPNTNGFKQGGVVKKMTGQYWFDENTKVYKLASNDLKTPVFLRSMSHKVIHFCDEKNQLLVGDDGYGYALNLKEN
jgi:hypothetical protein